MLLNFSNHPFSEWDETQRAAAITRYGRVQDYAFPSVDPEASHADIHKLAEYYSNVFQKLAPTAVHIMGEMTFVYAMVRRLTQLGIPCIASTTRRKAVKLEDGSYRRVFEFADFRIYNADE